MVLRVHRLAQGLGLAAALTAAALLAGCSAQPYPTPSAEGPPPSEPAPELAGGPAAPPPPPEYAPPPPPSYAPPPPVITMAPIPNPPEPPPRARRAQRRAAPPPVRRAQRPHSARPPVTARAQPARPQPARPAAPPAAARAAPPPARPAPARPAQPVAPPPAVAKAPPAPALKPALPPAAAAPQAAANAAPPAAAGVAALQGQMSKLAPQAAQLGVPAQFVANQPAEVTLTFPADFADVLKREAANANLGDAAASANLTARLVGDDYAISPDETQSAPLIAGQPTVFRWSVVPRSERPGPLTARLGADLLGGGAATLDLGEVKSGEEAKAGLTPRLIGLGLLVLIAAVIVAWLTRRRERWTKSTPEERRAQRRAVRNGRPLDLHEKEFT